MRTKTASLGGGRGMGCGGEIGEYKIIMNYMHTTEVQASCSRWWKKPCARWWMRWVG